MRAVWGVSVLALARAAHADPPRLPYDPAVDVQLFQMALGPKTFLTVADAEGGARGQLAVDLGIAFATRPFTSQHADVVRSITEGQLAATYAITDRFQAGVALPIVYQIHGADYDMATGEPATGGLDVHGIGDLHLELKARLARTGGVRIGAIVGATLATSNGSDNAQFTGDQTASGQAKLAVEWTRGRLAFGANAGALARAHHQVYDAGIGPALAYGAAATIRVTDQFSLIAEGFGQVNLTSPDRGTAQHPAEVIAGARVHLAPAFAVVVGGGAGLTRDQLGAPVAQLFASLEYGPPDRDLDRDRDGIPDRLDRCPLQPEDKDGIEDTDGCPEDDADGDKNPDATDKCPLQPEDLDGYQDEDGCPELDNDGDGVPDLEDKCPNDAEDGLPPFPHDACPARMRDSDGDGLMDDKDQCPLAAEDFDGFEDADGCPEPDNDGDGVPDATDRCPLCPEDRDGFEDADGCPDEDNDRDGFPDAVDKCPNEPETVNGIADDDGCPDTGAPVAVHLEGDQLVVDAPPSVKIATQMALVMRAHREVTKWVVAVVQPTLPAAKRLSAAIHAELVQRGVTAALQMLETAGPAKIAAAVTERAETEAAPACPNPVHERPERAAPAPAQPPPPPESAP